MSIHPLDEEGRVIPDASWPPGRGAPGRLEHVRRFLNTTNRESGADHLAEPGRAGRWLAAEGWTISVQWSEVAELCRFRTQLHAVIAAGFEEPRRVWPAAFTDAALALDSEDGTLHLVGAGHGAERVVNDLVAIVVHADADGTLGRLAVCANDHCGWSFYDRSKNRTGQWCSMTACGQRQKMRRYRSRHRAR